MGPRARFWGLMGSEVRNGGRLFEIFDRELSGRLSFLFMRAALLEASMYF